MRAITTVSGFHWWDFRFLLLATPCGERLTHQSELIYTLYSRLMVDASQSVEVS